MNKNLLYIFVAIVALISASIAFAQTASTTCTSQNNIPCSSTGIFPVVSSPTAQCKKLLITNPVGTPVSVDTTSSFNYGPATTCPTGQVIVGLWVQGTSQTTKQSPSNPWILDWTGGGFGLYYYVNASSPISYPSGAASVSIYCATRTVSFSNPPLGPCAN